MNSHERWWTWQSNIINGLPAAFGNLQSWQSHRTSNSSSNSEPITSASPDLPRICWHIPLDQHELFWIDCDNLWKSCCFFVSKKHMPANATAKFETLGQIKNSQAHNAIRSYSNAHCQRTPEEATMMYKQDPTTKCQIPIQMGSPKFGHWKCIIVLYDEMHHHHLLYMYIIHMQYRRLCWRSESLTEDSLRVHLHWRVEGSWSLI